MGWPRTRQATRSARTRPVSTARFLSETPLIGRLANGRSSSVYRPPRAPDMSRLGFRHRAEDRELIAAKHRRLMRAPLGPIPRPTSDHGENPMSEPTIVEFDLDRYLRNSKKVDLGGIEWSGDPGPPALRRRRDVPPLHDGHRDAHGDLSARPARHPRRRRPADHGVPELLGLRGALARGGVLRLPALLRHRGAGRAEASRTARPRCPPAPTAGATCGSSSASATGWGSCRRCSAR